jgi:3',5'-cyclic AMP phosphodiesterase CpdA
MFKIAHISDLHFSKISFNPSIFFSKRFIGILNLIFNRNKSYTQKILHQLPKLFDSLEIKHVFITGDLTSTSMIKEFQAAKNFINQFDKKINLFIIPGNHDHYTKKSFKKNLFYQFFNSPNTHLLKSLKNEKIEVYPLSENWYYIGLDTCIPTHLFSSGGLFSKDLENHLVDILEKIPKEKNILLVNHFPLIQDVAQRKILKRREVLYKILKKYTNIKLYLHGHTHKASIEKSKDLPYMICSGCVSYKKNASFNILEISDYSCKIINYLWKEEKWQKNSTTQIKF